MGEHLTVQSTYRYLPKYTLYTVPILEILGISGLPLSGSLGITGDEKFNSTCDCRGLRSKTHVARRTPPLATASASGTPHAGSPSRIPQSAGHEDAQRQWSHRGIIELPRAMANV